MSLLALFAPGRGRRRNTSTQDPQRAAIPCDLTRVVCSAGNAAHPVWWTDEVPGHCPWCLAESLADQVMQLTIDLEFFRVPAPVGPPMVPAPKDMPGYGLSASTAAKTCQDATLASLVESAEDAEILSALGLSIPAPADAADTLLLDTSRLHGPSETTVMPAVMVGPVFDAGGHNIGERPPRRQFPLATPSSGPLLTTWGIDPAPASQKPLFRDEQSPARPESASAITAVLPLPQFVVQLARDTKPLIRPGAEVCTVTAERAAASVHDQLANAT